MWEIAGFPLCYHRELGSRKWWMKLFPLVLAIKILYFFSMSQKGSFYDILEISDHNASSEEIRKNYQRLTLLHHPDKSARTAPANLENFVKIKQAWETLKDGVLRREYDILLESTKNPKWPLLLTQIMQPKRTTHYLQFLQRYSHLCLLTNSNLDPASGWAQGNGVSSRWADVRVSLSMWNEFLFDKQTNWLWYLRILIWIIFFTSTLL